MESGKVTRAQDLSGFQQGEIELLQRRVDREDHEGQETVDQPHHHRERGVEHGNRIHSDLRQPAVDQPGVSEQEDHGEGPDQEAGPERKHDEEEEEVLPASGPGNHVGDRIAQHQADHGAGHRPYEGALEDVQVQRVEEPPIVLQREAGVHPAVDPTRHHAVHQHDEDGNQEEHQQPERPRPQQQPGPCLRPGVQPTQEPLPR
jgi:hypothetical protein